jgi:hypothetical protein
MDNPWIIRILIIHGLSMDHPWIIYGSSMDYLLIIHGHPLTSMNFQGLGEPVGHVGGTGQHIPVEPLGRETPTPTSCRK